jgi:hypothetical protein
VPGDPRGVEQVLRGAFVRAALEERESGRLMGRRRIGQPLVAWKPAAAVTKCGAARSGRSLATNARPRVQQATASIGSS